MQRQGRGQPESSPQSASQRGLRILLVEDHADTANILARLLEDCGHQVSKAAALASALRESELRQFDLLICDLSLPDGTGLDLLRELQRRGKVLPAIALTGHGSDLAMRRTRAAGFIAHLVKPFEFEQLEQAIAALQAPIS